MYLGRDAGWINLCTSNPQEAYDMTICAFKIAEDLKVRLPVMVHQDGFMSSHTAQNVCPLSDDDAYEFIGEYVAVNAMLDPSKPVTHGVQTEEDWHFEHKARQHNDLMNSVSVIKDVFAQFEAKTGRKYNLVDSYKADDAEVIIVVLGTSVDTSYIAVDQLRAEGLKVGVVSPRVLRPFPMEELRSALGNAKVVGCLDRSAPGGTVGMLYNEIAGALINCEKRPLVCDYIYGLGGRDMTIDNFKTIFKELKADADAGKLTHEIQQFFGVRGPKLSYYKA
jgi:pyruvate ferredoxin oxidoreductase alpha subunit